MKQKVITIRDDQAEWIDEYYFKLSPYVQAMLDEEIKRRGEKDGS